MEYYLQQLYNKKLRNKIYEEVLKERSKCHCPRCTAKSQPGKKVYDWEHNTYITWDGKEFIIEDGDSEDE